MTIEINKGKGSYLVSYFIPKICNVAMVNDLKGVQKVTENSRNTRGSFTTTLDKLPEEVISFISKVPMDKDMPQFKYYK